jgi:hypothetical protein
MRPLSRRNVALRLGAAPAWLAGPAMGVAVRFERTAENEGLNANHEAVVGHPCRHRTAESQVAGAGLGEVTEFAVAKADMQADLQAPRTHMKKAVNDGVDASAALKPFDATLCMRLLNAAELMPDNASRIALKLERE